MKQYQVCAVFALLCAIPHAFAFSVGELSRVRCVSNYIFQEDAHDVSAWQRDLDAMRKAGLNTVWMINVWAAYQPDVDSEEWREDRIAALRDICASARDRHMNLLLALAYIGEGWGPKGVDVPVWPLVPEHRRQHLAFLRRMAHETREFDNVFYLLCSEEILPATVLYRPSRREECVRSFRDWAKKANPDIDHWNTRWATDYTWDNLAPADTDKRPRWQLWADHSRWHGHLLRELLPLMVAAIREEHPGAIVGYHDFLVPSGLDLTAADGGLEMPTPFDFYSVGYYYNHELDGGLDANLEGLKSLITRARELYPTLPVFCGELGLDAKPGTDEETLKADFLTRAVALLESKKVGFSIWSWRTTVASAQRSHSLLRPDHTPTPALLSLRDHWNSLDAKH